MKKKFSYKRYVKRIYLYVTRMLEKGEPLINIRKGLRRIVNSYEGLNRNERYALFNSAYNGARQGKHGIENLTSRKVYDSILHTARNVKSNLNLKRNKMKLFDTLKDSSNSIIFYCCSWHTHPAEGHKDYQGKIYVDRYWRQKTPQRMHYSVSSYIRNHGTITVQDAMEGPIWLLTRPYCKHYFIPIQTEEVLTNSANKIAREYAYRPETPYTVKDYYLLRNEVFRSASERVDDYTVKEAFIKKIRRSV